MSIPPSALADVAHYLEEQDEGQRIKKLLFCLSKKYWENDPNVLDTNGLDALLAELVVQKPTIEQFTFSLYKLVKTLNRPKVYAAVAKTILDQLGPIYTAYGETAIPGDAKGEEGAIAAVSSANQSPTPVHRVVDPQYQATQIAHILAQHREQVRIQKLVFAVARGYWENNLQAIEEVGLANLLLELRQRYPTPSQLKEGFSQIVNNINKSTFYLAIAKLILEQMQVLYDGESHQGDHASVLENEPQTNLTMAPSPDALANKAQATSIVDFNALPIPTPPPRPRQSEPILTVLGAVVPSPPGTLLQAQTEKKEYDLFEIRSEIMQYTNPLRAKVLLFSVLFQSWDEHSPDWSLVRSYALDDLVEQLILSRRRPNEVEIKLNALASQMFDQEEYQQTAQTLIKIIKPLF
ncbi:hypothetical protein IQE94_12720 [Synechocystis sp. PCC 7339]|uniref:hypothetical protein n=1 Tax=unclassified Synechocystis TaxID=2640012 RepID=UPI001BAFDBFE|nr:MULTISPECIES: hypothetical protein [unclassified Synechocystis]QUS60585.1 hypothetical protein HTZ78_07805 [Synechocystis sp. PCC 7338]UAJ71970.1 hypothetical protein IQE94_12720 [Synechocystis sp. PCC 7339]